MQSLQSQLRFELKRFNVSSKSIETIFIGGGTPSTVDAKLYKPLFEMLEPYLDSNIEITSEANPNSATKEWLRGMYELGVNRISFGVQSFDDKKLKILNRAHNSTQAKEAIINAHKIGFKNLSLDIIYATLGDTKELLQKDIDTAISLPINHLSAYALTIEEGTPFEYKPQMAKEKLDLTQWLFDELDIKGFQQYEISNFGAYKSLHNSGYWEYKDYIGLGSGAVGKLKLQRFYPSTNLEEYIKNPLNIKTENLSEYDKKLEQIFLGFRSYIGVKKEILNSDEQKKADILVEEDKLSLDSEIYYNKEYLLADEIALFLTS